MNALSGQPIPQPGPRRAGLAAARAQLPLRPPPTGPEPLPSPKVGPAGGERILHLPPVSSSSGHVENLTRSLSAVPSPVEKKVPLAAPSSTPDPALKSKYLARKAARQAAASYTQSIQTLRPPQEQNPAQSVQAIVKAEIAKVEVLRGPNITAVIDPRSEIQEPKLVKDLNEVQRQQLLPQPLHSPSRRAQPVATEELHTSGQFRDHHRKVEWEPDREGEPKNQGQSPLCMDPDDPRESTHPTCDWEDVCPYCGIELGPLDPPMCPCCAGIRSPETLALLQRAGSSIHYRVHLTRCLTQVNSRAVFRLKDFPPFERAARWVLWQEDS